MSPIAGGGGGREKYIYTLYNESLRDQILVNNGPDSDFSDSRELWPLLSWGGGVGVGGRVYYMSVVYHHHAVCMSSVGYR